MEKETNQKLIRGATILTAAFGLSVMMLSPTETGAYCLDRPNPPYPNTGYCTWYNNAYHCIPGGVSCDGDQEH